jgi:hypothetical protein
MLWITLLIASVIALAVAAYVVRPLFQTGAAPVLVEDERLAELLSRKDGVLRAIKDLEFDYQVGKLGEEDYQRFDQSLRRQAISLLQQIEKIAPESSQLDEQLEAEIARSRMVQSQPRVTTNMASPAPGPSAAPGPQRFCTACGAALAEGFRFCGQCGTPIATQVSAGAKPV